MITNSVDDVIQQSKSNNHNRIGKEKKTAKKLNSIVMRYKIKIKKNNYDSCVHWLVE